MVGGGGGWGFAKIFIPIEFALDLPLSKIYVVIMVDMELMIYESIVCELGLMLEERKAVDCRFWHLVWQAQA